MKLKGCRVTRSSSATVGCASWKASSARVMFSFPRYPWGHWVHVTKSASIVNA